MKRILLIFTTLVILFTASDCVKAQGAMNVGGQLTLAVPTGDLGNVVSTGFGFIGTFGYKYMPNIDITGKIGFVSFGEKSGLSGFADYSFSVIPILVGGKMYLGVGEILPYVGADLGLYMSSVSSSSKVEYYNPWTGTTTTITSDVSGSDTDLGFSPQFGVKYGLAPNIMLDANLAYNIIFSGGNSSYLGINVGVSMGL